MKISICSKLFDYNGNFLIDYDLEQSEVSFLSRRVSRIATLDGKASVVDNGYTASDATFVVVLKDIDLTIRASLLTMFKLHSLITMSVNSGVFVGVIENVQDKDTLKIKFLVKEQING